MKIATNIIQSFDKAYEKGGMGLLIDKVNEYNNKIESLKVPMVFCQACDCETPCVENVCLGCGRDIIK
jgi:hypothetical protein